MIVNNIQSIGKIASVKDFFQALTGQLFQVEIISKGANNEGLISLGGHKLQAQLESQFMEGEKFQAFVKEVTEQGIVLSRVRPDTTPNRLGERPTMNQIAQALTQGFGISAEDAAYLAKYITGNDHQREETTRFLNNLLGKGSKPETKNTQPELFLLPGKQDWTLQKGTQQKGMHQNDTQYIRTQQNGPQADTNEIKKSVEPGQTLRLTAGQLNTIVNRGIALNQEITTLMAKYVNDPDGSELKTLLTNTTDAMNPLTALLWKIIPNWPQLNGKQFETILTYLKKLGLEHENRLANKLKTTGSQEDVDTQDNSLKSLLSKMVTTNAFHTDNQEGLDTTDNSVKTLLLRMATADSLNADTQKAAKNFLEQLTGQQLWAQSGNNDAAYFLLHLPLQDNGSIYHCKVAVESSRKGTKADIAHCHLALQVETQNLNMIGIDMNLYNNDLSICLLSDGQSDLESLIAALSEPIAQGFTDIGLNLEKITFKTYDEFPQFASFIAGQNLLGVDIKG